MVILLSSCHFTDFQPLPRQLSLRAGLTLADLAVVDYIVSSISSLT